MRVSMVKGSYYQQVMTFIFGLRLTAKLKLQFQSGIPLFKSLDLALYLSYMQNFKHFNAENRNQALNTKQLCSIHGDVTFKSVRFAFSVVLAGM